MRISEYFHLGKGQAELDFIDVDIEGDMPLFLDPFFLSIREDRWSISASSTIKSFFQRTIDLIRDGQADQARRLFENLHEPNSTCLGLSRGRPRGRGVGPENTSDIFDRMLQSRAVDTGLIEHLEDNHLFVENFGKDKLSDMTTNIIRKHLIDYTETQCSLHGMPLTRTPSGFYWNPATSSWEAAYVNSLVIDGRIILLVPKGIVSYTIQYTPDRYYQHFVLNFLQNEHLRMKSALVDRRRDGTRFVTKKSIREQNPFSKEFLRDFTTRHPEVLARFKEATRQKPLSNSELADINIQQLAQVLIDRLVAIPTGSDSASEYHKHILGIVELLFYPSLINPRKEVPINEGRKRIDITFDNGADEGVFKRLSEHHGIPCPYIMMECKNYSSDPANPELDQLNGRFSPNRGKVGLMLCRTMDNVPLFLNRCRDTFRDSGNLIIPLTDVDVIDMLRELRSFTNEGVERLLTDKVRSVVMG